MKKLVLIAICLILLIGCSNPSERREAAKEVTDGEIIYQMNNNVNHARDMIAIKTKNAITVHYINMGGEVRGIIKIYNDENFEIIYGKQ